MRLDSDYAQNDRFARRMTGIAQNDGDCARTDGDCARTDGGYAQNDKDYARNDGLRNNTMVARYCGTRTSIRPHSSQVTTWSGLALATVSCSLGGSTKPQPSHFPPQ